MRLFIGRLDKSTTEETLQTIFSRIGVVKKIEVRDGSTSGIAFVYYQDDEDAKKAIEQLNGSEVDGAMITVEEARQKPLTAGPPVRDMRYERDYRDRDRDPYGYHNQPPRYNDGPPAPQRSAKEVIVRHELRFRVHGVPQGTTWRDLKDWSRVAGEVTFANVSNSVEGPIGVIEFVSADDYAKAKEVLEEAPLQGARVTLTREVNEDGTLAPGVKLLPPSDAQRPRGQHSSSGGYDDHRGRPAAYPPPSRESRVYRESDYRPAPSGYYRDDHRGPPPDDHHPNPHHAYDDRGRAPPHYRDPPPRERERERDGYRGDDRGYADYRAAATRPRSRSRDRERAEYDRGLLDALPPRASAPAPYDSRSSGYDSRPPAYDYPPRAPPASYESSRPNYPPPERRVDAPPRDGGAAPRASYPPPARDDRDRERERERDRERLPPPSSEGLAAYPPDTAYAHERSYR